MSSNNTRRYPTSDYIRRFPTINSLTPQTTQQVEYFLVDITAEPVPGSKPIEYTFYDSWALRHATFAPREYRDQVIIGQFSAALRITHSSESTAQAFVIGELIDSHLSHYYFHPTTNPIERHLLERLESFWNHFSETDTQSYHTGWQEFKDHEIEQHHLQRVASEQWELEIAYHQQWNPIEDGIPSDQEEDIPEEDSIIDLTIDTDSE